MKLLNFAFQIYFLKGSFVKDKVYEPLLKNISTSIKIYPAHLFHERTYEKDSIVIGHSFGGFLSLWDYGKNQDKIKGLILLNSHMNNGGKAVYSKINSDDIPIPILTILGGKDKQLPIDVSYWDMIEDQKTHHYYYIDKDIGHYDMMTNHSYQKKYSEILTTFIQNINENNFSSIEKLCSNRRKEFVWDSSKIVKKSQWISTSMNLMDALMSTIVDKKIWNGVHFLYFLYFKPWIRNGLFASEEDIWIKSRNTSLEEIITNYHCLNPIMKTYEPIHKDLGILYPYSLWIWLWKSPKIKESQYEIYKIDFGSWMTYYKVPHPHRFFIDYLKKK